jgi:hypothetical protein
VDVLVLMVSSLLSCCCCYRRRLHAFLCMVQCARRQPLLQYAALLHAGQTMHTVISSWILLMVVQLGWLQHSFSGSAATSRPPKSCSTIHASSLRQHVSTCY